MWAIARNPNPLPLELRITWLRTSGSIPAAAPSMSPSAPLAMLQNATMLLTILAMLPEPSSPVWMTFLPNDSKRERCSSKSARSPPTMIAMVAFSAPEVPPLTGASSIRIPFGASRSAMLRTMFGELVLRSMWTVPWRALSPIPPSPSATASTSRGIGSDVNTTSDSATASAMEPTPAPPTSSQRRTAAASRSWTRISCPLFLIMLRHIGPPMFPTPMNPTFMWRPPACP